MISHYSFSPRRLEPARLRQRSLRMTGGRLTTKRQSNKLTCHACLVIQRCWQASRPDTKFMSTNLNSSSGLSRKSSRLCVPGILYANFSSHSLDDFLDSPDDELRFDS